MNLEPTTEVVVEMKSNYGNEAIYPVCATARLFAEIAGNKTLSRRDIRLIKELGYTVTVRQPQVNL